MKTRLRRVSSVSVYDRVSVFAFAALSQFPLCSWFKVSTRCRRRPGTACNPHWIIFLHSSINMSINIAAGGAENRAGELLSALPTANLFLPALNPRLVIVLKGRDLKGTRTHLKLVFGFLSFLPLPREVSTHDLHGISIPDEPASCQTLPVCSCLLLYLHTQDTLCFLHTSALFLDI